MHFHLGITKHIAMDMLSIKNSVRTQVHCIVDNYIVWRINPNVNIPWLAIRRKLVRII